MKKALLSLIDAAPLLSRQLAVAPFRWRAGLSWLAERKLNFLHVTNHNNYTIQRSLGICVPRPNCFAKVVEICFPSSPKVYRKPCIVYSELRVLFKHIRTSVEERPGRQSNNLPWQGILAFCFLRFISPAILYPKMWGLYPGLPSESVLELVAKTIQNLANLMIVSSLTNMWMY